MSSQARVHIHLSVSDLEKSRHFYEKLLGVTPVKEKPGYVKFLPELGPLNLALSQGAPGARSFPVDHAGIEVGSREAVRRHLDRVKAAGLPVREEIAVNCCYANQDKFWATDPDGVEWEVYHVNHDVETFEPSLADACGEAARGCCGSS